MQQGHQIGMHVGIADAAHPAGEGAWFLLGRAMLMQGEGPQVAV